MLLIVGILLIVFGIWIWIEVDKISEFSIDYTNCKSSLASGSISCENALLQKNLTHTFSSCICIRKFNISHDFIGPVTFYYTLSNFYQNYKRYLASKDDNQLQGKPVTELSVNCEPYRYDPITKLPYEPCGGIANSIFNDTFQLFYEDISQNQTIQVPWSSKNITWQTDRDELYGIPKSITNSTKPPNWKYNAKERSSNYYKGDEDLIVWMKLAAFPTFRKKYRYLKRSDKLFHNGLPEGSYELHINYSFPVSYFNGSKGFLISTDHWLGSKNYSMPVLFFVSGFFHIVASVFLFGWACCRTQKIGAY